MQTTPSSRLSRLPSVPGLSLDARSSVKSAIEHYELLAEVQWQQDEKRNEQLLDMKRQRDELGAACKEAYAIMDAMSQDYAGECQENVRLRAQLMMADSGVKATDHRAQAAEERARAAHADQELMASRLDRALSEAAGLRAGIEALKERVAEASRMAAAYELRLSASSLSNHKKEGLGTAAGSAGPTLRDRGTLLTDDTDDQFSSALTTPLGCLSPGDLSTASPRFYGCPEGIANIFINCTSRRLSTCLLDASEPASAPESPASWASGRSAHLGPPTPGEQEEQCHLDRAFSTVCNPSFEALPQTRSSTQPKWASESFVIPVECAIFADLALQQESISDAAQAAAQACPRCGCEMMAGRGADVFGTTSRPLMEHWGREVVQLTDEVQRRMMGGICKLRPLKVMRTEAN